MKTLLRLAIIIALMITGTTSLYAQQEYRRTIEKSCPVTVKAISIDHNYSSVTITEWDKPEIAMTAEIITKASTMEEAKEISEYIDVKFFPNLAEGTKIQTKIDHDRINKMRTKSRNYSVNISIKAPRSLVAIVKMTFGSTTINVPLKSLTADGSYGSIKASKIDEASRATVKFGNVSIDKINGMLNASVKYGNITIGEGQNMNIRAEFGNANIEKANVIDGFISYGSFNVTNAKDVIMSAIDFSHCRIEDFQNELTVASLRYGSLNASTTENFKSISVKAEFSPVKITLSGSPSYTCNLQTQFSEIQSAFPVSSVVTSSKGSTNSTAIVGTVRNGGDKSIIITNRYANIAILRK